MNIKNLALYAGSAMLVALLLYVLPQSGTAIGIIWAVAFWGILGLDFYVSQVKENGAGELRALENHGPAGTSLVDRFFAYLFFAPFIAPARVYQLVNR